MTDTTDTAGRSGLGQNDRLVGLVRLAIGLAQGIALYLLVTVVMLWVATRRPVSA